MPDNSARGQLSPKARTSQPVSKDKSARMSRQLGPYYCSIFICVLYNSLFIYLKDNYYLLVKKNYLFNDNITCDQKCD